MCQRKSCHNAYYMAQRSKAVLHRTTHRIHHLICEEISKSRLDALAPPFGFEAISKMATVDVWRTRLNDLTFCKKLRENNAKDSKHKTHNDDRRLLTVFDSKLFVWDCSQTHLIYFNLLNVLGEKSSSISNHYQVQNETESRISWIVTIQHHS